MIDNALHLVAAAGHDWGIKAAAYDLSADAVLTGAQAGVLAGLGTHFNAGGHILTVQDNAANVVAATTALASLGHPCDGRGQRGIDRRTSSRAAGARRRPHGHFTPTIQTRSAAPPPAALAPFAGKLTGPALVVQDTAAGIDGHLAALQSLAAHLAITVYDSAAAIGADAADLASLGAALTVSLAGGAPVTAAVAAELVPLAGQLAAGAVAVTDTAAAIAANRRGPDAAGWRIKLHRAVGRQRDHR